MQTSTVVGHSEREIAQAAEILRKGGLVAFPTETVYGLGARAADAGAVARIFAAKGRPAGHPLIVHLGAAEELDRWAREVPAAARALAAACWPGPLTLILKRHPDVLDAVTGGQETVGLRVPDHPVALRLLRAAGGGLAAPSANRYGRLSPTTAAHVLSELGDAVHGIVDGGACSVGLESTIVDLSGQAPRVLRPGAITAAALAEVLGEMPEGGESIPPALDSPRVPGSCASHYAPGAPVYLVDEACIARRVRQLVSAERAVAVLATCEPLAHLEGCTWHAMPGDPESYARSLYARLREADDAGADCIVVQRPPATPAWEAVRDRLRRASGGAEGAAARSEVAS